MSALDTLLDDVMPDLKGCPIALVRYHVKRTIIDFHFRSGAKRKTTAPMDVGATGVFTLPASEIDADEQLIGVLKAWWFEIPLEVWSLDSVQEEFGASWKTIAGTPQCITQEDDDSIILVPQPDSATTASLVLSIIYGPNESVANIDDSLLARFRDELACGVKARLMAMKDKPWSDANLAAAYGGVYEDAIGAMSARRTRGPAGATLKTKPFGF